MNIYKRIFTRVISVVFSIYLFTFTITLNASEASPCVGNIADTFGTFCEQTARRAALEIDWGFLKKTSLSKERHNEKQDAKEIITAEFSLEYNTDNLEDTSNNFDKIKSFEWPRPKILDRSYEAAVSLLDLKGKRDLRSCTLYELKNLSKLSKSLPKHQLDAMFHFSNAHLDDINTVDINSKSDLNSKSCKQLLILVLGRA